MKPDQVVLATELRKTVKGMEIPSFRIRDLHWLNKNLGKRNANHPEFNKAMGLIRQLMTQGVANLN